MAVLAAGGGPRRQAGAARLEDLDRVDVRSPAASTHRDVRLTGIDRGRMLWFFATADITTPTGRYRFRLPPGKTDRFLTQLRLLCTL